MAVGERFIQSLDGNERLLALLVGEGLTDNEIAIKTGNTRARVDLAVRDLLRRCRTSRLGLSLVVLTRILTSEELVGWTAQAEANRQRLYDAGVVDFSTVRLVRRLATNEYWLVHDQIIGRHEQMSAATVRDLLTPWERVLGNRIVMQVTMRLAPIHPLFWAKTDRNRRQA